MQKSLKRLKMGPMQGKQTEQLPGDGDHSSNENNGLILNGYALYPDILSLILLYVPDVDLLRRCQLVCKTWKQLIDSHSLWKRKAIMKGHHFPSGPTICDLSPTAYKLISLKNPFRRNLIRNPYGKDSFNGWQIDEYDDTFMVAHRRQNGFKVEDPPVGSDLLDTVDELKDVATSCFATTYYPCRKQQIIDLYKEGCSEEIMQTLKPAIYICDWFAARFDCGSKYNLDVYLLGKNKDQIKVFTHQHEEAQWTGSRWEKVEHTFSDTESVRYVKFVHAGKDTQFWAGHYGIKMTGSTVMLKCD